MIRGYSVSAVLCLQDPYYRNHEFLQEYFDDKNIKFWDVKAPPKKVEDRIEDAQRLEEWYSEVEASGPGSVGDCVDWLDTEHQQRMSKLDSMAERTLNSVWWPFTQHGIVNKKEEVMVIDSAHGDHFDAYYAKPPLPAGKSSREGNESWLNPYFDGSASWFT